MLTPELSFAELEGQHCMSVPARRLMTMVIIAGNNITFSAGQTAVATVSGINNVALVSNSINVANTVVYA